MNTIRKTTMAVLTISATILLALPALAAEWNLDTSHSSVAFEVRHMAISKVKGGREMLDGVEAFWVGLNEQRIAASHQHS